MSKQMPVFVVALLLALAGAVGATTLQEVEVTCPVCSLKFKVFEVMSTNSFGGQDTDFCVHAAGTPPDPYAVWTCPKCLYSGSAETFAKAVSEETKKKVLAELKSPWPIKEDMSQKDIPGWVKFDLAASVAGWEGVGPADVAGLYLEASWAARVEVERCFQSLYSDPEKRALFEDRSHVLALIVQVLEEDAALKPSLEAFRQAIDALWSQIFEGSAGEENRKDLDMKLAEALLARVGEGKLPAEEAALEEFAAGAVYRVHGENLLAIPILKKLRTSEALPAPFRTVAGNMLESIDVERRYQRKFIETAKPVLDKNLLEGGKLAAYLYLVGELHRRLGEPAEAASWYKKAIACPDIPAEGRAMAEAQLKSLGLDAGAPK